MNLFLIPKNLFQVLVDRYEDITHPDIIHSNPKASRDVSLYGYVRGTHLKPNMPVHIPGAGDFGTFFLWLFERFFSTKESEQERDRKGRVLHDL